MCVHGTFVWPTNLSSHGCAFSAQAINAINISARTGPRTWLSPQVRLTFGLLRVLYCFWFFDERNSDTDFPSRRGVTSVSTCAGNWLRTVTSDQHRTYNNSSLSFCARPYVHHYYWDRDDWEVTNLLFVLPGLYLKLRRHRNFGWKNSPKECRIK